MTRFSIFHVSCSSALHFFALEMADTAVNYCRLPSDGIFCSLVLLLGICLPLCGYIFPHLLLPVVAEFTLAIWARDVLQLFCPVLTAPQADYSTLLLFPEGGAAREACGFSLAHRSGPVSEHASCLLELPPAAPHLGLCTRCQPQSQGELRV